MDDELKKIKIYDKETRKFIYREVDRSMNVEQEIIFETFEEFAKFFNDDLSDSDLLDYDFKGIDLHKYDLKGVGISSLVLMEQGLNDDSFYNENIGRVPDNLSVTFSESQEMAVKYDETATDADELIFSRDNVVYYVTDLHLNHKIKKRYPHNASEYEVRQYLREVAKGIRGDFINFMRKFLLIGGDVSFNFKISKMFYEELVQLIEPCKIIVVIGNHELWNYGYNADAGVKESLEDVIENYRELFRDLGIIFLQNELLAIDDFDRSQKLSENDLEGIKIDKIREIFVSSRLTILGGIGFSGYNESFNAKNGIYRSAIDNIDDELIQTKKFEKVYCKVESALSDLPVIVFTHMPKDGWTLRPYNKNWIYVSGHTHKNYYCSDAEKTIYSDNQIGYNGTSIRLKYFELSNKYDSFRYYEDGIFEIDRNQYINFYRGLNIYINFNRKNCTIYMLKNSGTYCFLLKKHENDKLFFLYGGQIKSVEKQDLSYYFSNLRIYSDAVNRFTHEYNVSLSKLSAAVKAVGGDGNIHGCIVDIDFYNHIYLNPFDGKITPYFAEDMVNKWVYENVPSLLFLRRGDLYDNYRGLINNDEKISALAIIGDHNTDIVKKSEAVPDTDIYRVSRIFLGFQYTTNCNVVRIWNDNLIKLNDEDKIQYIMSNLLPDGEK